LQVFLIPIKNFIHGFPHNTRGPAKIKISLFLRAIYVSLQASLEKNRCQFVPSLQEIELEVFIVFL
jgi:hypothetical protein